MSRCSDCGDDTENGNRLCYHCAKVRRLEAADSSEHSTGSPTSPTATVLTISARSVEANSSSFDERYAINESGCWIWTAPLKAVG